MDKRRHNLLVAGLSANRRVCIWFVAMCLSVVPGGAHEYARYDDQLICRRPCCRDCRQGLVRPDMPILLWRGEARGDRGPALASDNFSTVAGHRPLPNDSYWNSGYADAHLLRSATDKGWRIILYLRRLNGSKAEQMSSCPAIPPLAKDCSSATVTAKLS